MSRGLQANGDLPDAGYVLVVLTRDAPPKLSSIEEVPESMIRLDGHELADAGLGDWIGFYDWLRNKSKAVIGVRLWIDEPNVHTAAIAECQNARVDPSWNELVIFFGADRDFDSALSDDQDFGGNRLFVGFGWYALTFNAPLPR